MSDGADPWAGQELLDQQEQMEMNVYKKLMQARIALQGTRLDKSGHNKFAGYKYFELGDFLPAVQDIFSGLGLCGVINYGKDEACLTITDTSDGSSIAVCSPMSEANLKGCHPVQNLGAVQTYIRRYLWVTAMEVVEHDALDSTTGKNVGDPEDVEFAESKAFEVRALMLKKDIAGAAATLNTLGANGEYDAEAKEMVYIHLDSTMRSGIKAYDAITQAKTHEGLRLAVRAAPKHSIDMLLPFATRRKNELIAAGLPDPRLEPEKKESNNQIEGVTDEPKQSRPAASP